MGNCKHCGAHAGFMRRVHKECEQKHKTGREQILGLIRGAVDDSARIDLLNASVQGIANKHFIVSTEIRELAVEGWESAVDEAFEDGILSSQEELNLDSIQKHFALDQKELDRHGAYVRVVKGSVLREVLNGNIPEKLAVQGTLPFNFQKDERLVWLFQGVEYFEQKTHRHYEGGSHGMSVRVAKGVYLRTSAFRGHPVDKVETVQVDTGTLALTNKHIYFARPRKSFRVAYKKIVSFEPFSDGLGFQRDAATARPQTFVTGDGWFTYNLATNLSQLS